MPKPNRIIYPKGYWDKRIWDMKWEQLPELRKVSKRYFGARIHEDDWDEFSGLSEEDLLGHFPGDA